MPASQRDYTESSIVRAVLSSTWLIDERKMSEILAFLEFRAQGGRIDDDKVKEMFASEPMAGNEIFFDEDGNKIDVDGIRYLTVSGTMAPKMNLMMTFSGGTSTQRLSRQLREAEADDSVRTVLIDVDSPGGTASGTEEARQALFSLRQKKRTVVVARNIMASAAYYFGSAATEVFATPSTEVGSVGVYQVLQEITRAAENAGYKFEVIRAGALKASGIPYEKLTDERRASIQARVDAVYEMFVNSVAENLGINADVVIKSFGQGTVFMADEARARGMIHGVALFEDVLANERRRNSRRQNISSPSTREIFMKVTPKVKAALFLNDYVGDSQAEDSQCETVIRTLARAKGMNAEAIEAMDEAAMLDLINGKSARVNPTQVMLSELSETLVAEPVRTIESQQAGSERLRVLEINQAGRTMGIPDSVINAAIVSDDTVEQARERFVKHAASNQNPVTIVAGDSSIDKINGAIVGYFCNRLNLQGLTPTREEANYAQSMRGMTAIEVAREQLRVSGVTTHNMSKQQVASQWLGLGMGRHRAEATAAEFQTFDGQTILATANSSGDHADALSNLMGRVLDVGVPQEDAVTYTQWARRVPDLPDTRPASFIQTGLFHELDAIKEGGKHEELMFDSKLLAYIQAGHYGGKVGLTLEMVMNDDLGIFAEQLSELPATAVGTVDKACRGLLVSNPTMFEDGAPLFHASHGNLATAAVISDDSVSEHRKKHRAMKRYGSDQRMGLPIRMVMAPGALEQVTYKVLASVELKVPVLDANINTVRGTRYLIDGLLDDYSETRWYSFADQRLAPVAYGFVSGMGGDRGMRKTWQDPDSGTRYVAIDLWFAFAPYTHRGVVMNPGA